VKLRTLREEVVGASSRHQQLYIGLHHIDIRASQFLEVGQGTSVIEMRVVEKQDAYVLGLESELANRCFDQGAVPGTAPPSRKSPPDVVMRKTLSPRVPT
jgi:hypothetical protein